MFLVLCDEKVVEGRGMSAMLKGQSVGQENHTGGTDVARGT